VWPLILPLIILFFYGIFSPVNKSFFILNKGGVKGFHKELYLEYFKV
jgi:hypothetical protein